MIRTTALFSLALFVILSACCSAQISVGVLGGVNIANMKSSLTTESITMGTAGLVCDIPLFSGGSLCFQPNYLAAGARAPETATEPERLITLSYIELPVLLKYSFGTVVRPYLLAGPAASILTGSDVELSYGISNLKGSSKSVTRSGDFLLCIGGGCSCTLGKVVVFLEGHYALGLVDIAKAGSFTVTSGTLSQTITLDESEEMKNRGFRIVAGVAFEL